ncbi:MAG: ATP-binding protein [Deltaproteobacteria bacterium]|nr:ATP-binding protein [Deltaproteobacteria bacterium]
MKPCHCDRSHKQRRIVLTGGPGAGKTAVLELVRQTFCKHVVLLPESAGILFSGGFPRAADPLIRQAGQRAIYFVQRELEAIAEAQNAALVLCDRGTVDGGAYWPGPGDLWSAVGTSLASELARYEVVIHLRTPPAHNGYNHDNPLRIESAKEAAAIDARIEALWAGHPRRTIVPATTNFLAKAQAAVDCLRNELPACCRESA